MREFYALYQVLKYWRYFLPDKEIIVYMDHQPLQALQSQVKIEDRCHMKWVSYLQQSHMAVE